MLVARAPYNPQPGERLVFGCKVGRVQYDWVPDPPVPQPQPPDAGFILQAERSAGQYNSQGFGSSRYCWGSAEMLADEFRGAGFETVVRPDHRGADHYEVWVRGDGVVGEFRALNHLTLREWVRRQWGRGLNPRVYSPFLPHGFEELNGLDYFGGEAK